jgi:hypothetical protein
MSQVGKPIKKITIEPVESPVPQKETAPAPVPAEPEKVPA